MAIVQKVLWQSLTLMNWQGQHSTEETAINIKCTKSSVFWFPGKECGSYHTVLTISKKQTKQKN
jgi:hypothetical protein